MRVLLKGLMPLFLAGMSTSALAQAAQWRVTEVSGSVRLTENGSSRAAVKGALLASGAVITTGSQARAVLVRGEEYVVVSPGTQLRVPAPDPRNPIVQMIEDFGTAIFKIEKKSTPHFGVGTPYLAAVVKGTTFTVTVGAEGASVQVTEGAVEVSTLDGGASGMLRPGDLASVGANDLYQLSIEGSESRVIRSPEAPAGEVRATPAAYSGPATTPVQLALLVEATGSLSDFTDGLIDGGLAVEMAFAEVSDQVRFAGLVASPTVPTPAPEQPEAPVAAPGPVVEPAPQPVPAPAPIPEPQPLPDTGGASPDDNGVDRGKGSQPEPKPDDGNSGHGNDDDRFDDDNPGKGPKPKPGKDDHDHDDDDDGPAKGPKPKPDHDDHDHGKGAGKDLPPPPEPAQPVPALPDIIPEVPALPEVQPEPQPPVSLPEPEPDIDLPPPSTPDMGDDDFGDDTADQETGSGTDAGAGGGGKGICLLIICIGGPGH